MTYIGTIKKNEGENPHSLSPSSQRLVNSSIFGFQNNSTIFSYVPKKNKAVILLSTFHNNNEIVIDQMKNHASFLISASIKVVL